MEKNAPKIGVYLCYCGGNISDHVDVEEVRNRAEKMPGVTVAKTNMFMCSDPGQEMIIEDLKAGRVDRVVVASCAPSLHETTFRSAIQRAGANPFIYEHANIREQVSWVHHGDPATNKAAVLVASAAAKAELLKPLDPIRVDATRHATVIGGGIAGIKTALDISGRGIEVALIEKTKQLGGQLLHLDRLAPFGDKASDILEDLLVQVRKAPGITVYTGCEVTDVSGYVGNFNLSIARQGEILDLPTGAVVMATGSKPYQPKDGEFGYARHPEVVTLKELIRLLKDEGAAASRQTADGHLRFNGRPVRSMAMIHCVGSRQIPGIHTPKEGEPLNEYCSRTCCSAMLNTAVQIRETFPATRVFEMYRDIRTYGRGQEELYNRASASKVVFMRYEADAMPQVLKSCDPDFPLSVKITDTLTFNEELEVPADLVVLATGIEPSEVSKLASTMKLPIGNDRFLLEVHPKLRPVEFPISGIFLAGSCQAPMDSGEACNAAGAAAVKTCALLEKGYIELDPFVAQVDPDKCQGHGACVAACIKEGALTLVVEDGKKKARVTPAMCLGCGACAAVCPEKAIDVNGWALQQYENMVDAITAADSRAA